MKRILIACALALSAPLAACQTAPPATQAPQLTYAHLDGLSLNVAAIDVVSPYKPTYAKPHVEHLFPTPPADAVRRWASERLQASGTIGVGVLTIRDASVEESELPRDESLEALFTHEQTLRYSAVLDVRLDLSAPQGEGFVEARATRSITLSENATLNDREQAWLKMTEELIRDLSAALSENARTHLARWLR